VLLDEDIAHSPGADRQVSAGGPAGGRAGEGCALMEDGALGAACAPFPGNIAVLVGRRAEDRLEALDLFPGQPG